MVAPAAAAVVVEVVVVEYYITAHGGVSTIRKGSCCACSCRDISIVVAMVVAVLMVVW